MAAWDPGSGEIWGVTDSANYIPDLWSNEVIGAYKANVVMANLVTSFNHVGKKGDDLNIPKPGRISPVRDKSEGTVITIDADTAGTVQISLDKHKYLGTLIEDIAKFQALDSMRTFVTDDLGYQLAKQIDTDLLLLYSGFQSSAPVIGGDGTTAWDNSGSGNGSALTDAGRRPH